MDQKILILVAIVAILVVVAAFFLMSPGTDSNEITGPTITAGQPLELTSTNLAQKGVGIADDSAIAVAKIDIAELMDLLEESYGSMGMAMISSGLFDEVGVNADGLDSAVLIVYDYGGAASVYDTPSVELAALVSAKIDESKFMQYVKSQMPSATEETYKGTNLLVSKDSSATMMIGMLSDDLFIAGTEKSVKKVIDTTSTGVDSPFMNQPKISELSSQLGNYPTYAFMKITGKFQDSMVALSSLYGVTSDDIYSSVEAVAAGIGGGKQSKVIMLCDSEAAATKLKETQEAEIATMKQSMVAMDSEYSGGSYDELYGQFESIVSKITVSQSGKFVTIQGPTMDELFEVMNSALMLWQMGVFDSASSVTTNTMSGFGALRPVEWACSSESGTVSVMYTNGAGGQISNVSTTLGTAETVGTCDTGPVAAGGIFMCTATGVSECASASPGDAFEVDIDVDYVSPTGVQRTSSGTIRGPAE